MASSILNKVCVVASVRLKGAPESILQQVREKLPLMPGLIETIKTLQQHGWKTAIASGGFTYFADYLKSLLNL